MVEAGSETSGFAYAVEVAQHMVLPGIVLTIASLASYVRYTRNGMLEVINQDYIRTARAKGLNEKSRYLQAWIQKRSASNCNPAWLFPNFPTKWICYH